MAPDRNKNILDLRQTAFRAHSSMHDSLLLIRDHYSCSEVWQPKNSCCHRHQKGFRLCPALSHQKHHAAKRHQQKNTSLCPVVPIQEKCVCEFASSCVRVPASTTKISRDIVPRNPRSNSRRTFHQPTATLGYYHPDGARRSQAVLWMFCAKSNLCLFGTRGVSNQS